MPSKSKVQFIAGAICPKCKEADVIQQIETADEPIHWQCVECDFTADENNLPSTENETQKQAGSATTVTPVKWQ